MNRDWKRWAFDGSGAGAIALIRVVVGAVFLSEGIQKFLFPGELGVSRFMKIGIPAAELMAPFVGAVEIVGGSCLIAGLATRLVCVPLLVSMVVAITTTKVLPAAKVGVWKTLHEARTDVLMICGLLFLLLVGSGKRSLDARISSAEARRRRG
jgi:putative oxidoreductase